MEQPGTLMSQNITSCPRPSGTTPKSANPICEECGGLGATRRDVPVGHPDFGKPFPCRTCHTTELAGRLAAGSQLTGWLTGATLANYKRQQDNREAYQACVRFSQRPIGWLTLWGSYGSGKTHLLAAIVNACNAAGIGAVYYTFPELLAILREAVGENQFEHRFVHTLAVRVLVIDEVDDKANLTSWAYENLYRISDARYRMCEEQGTVFACQHKPDSSREPAAGRADLRHLYSRMSQGKVVHLTSGDARPRIAASGEAERG